MAEASTQTLTVGSGLDRFAPPNLDRPANAVE